ncbi:hypothetical protein D3C85_1205060 [compost metagenome]
MLTSILGWVMFLNASQLKGIVVLRWLKTGPTNLKCSGSSISPKKSREVSTKVARSEQAIEPLAVMPNSFCSSTIWFTSHSCTFGNSSITFIAAGAVTEVT